MQKTPVLNNKTKVSILRLFVAQIDSKYPPSQIHFSSSIRVTKVIRRLLIQTSPTERNNILRASSEDEFLFQFSLIFVSSKVFTDLSRSQRTVMVTILNFYQGYPKPYFDYPKAKYSTKFHSNHRILEEFKLFCFFKEKYKTSSFHFLLISMLCSSLIMVYCSTSDYDSFTIYF